MFIQIQALYTEILVQKKPIKSEVIPDEPEPEPIPEKTGYSLTGLKTKIQEKIDDYFKDREYEKHVEDWKIRRNLNLQWAETSVESLVLKYTEINISNPTIKGIYLYGDVGCGKTMMMDMFYKALKSTDLKGIKRIHFNAFMLKFQHDLHEIRKLSDKETHISKLAADIANESWVICFDEFQVVDVADAMTLKHLFIELWLQGVVVVFTGNKAPEELYKHGLTYKYFETFIENLGQHTEQIHIQSGVDYRKVVDASNSPSYFINSDDKFHELLLTLTNLKSTSQLASKKLSVFGKRQLTINSCHSEIAYFELDELIEEPLAAQDYLRICDEFDVLFIKGLSKLDFFEHKTKLRRLINLIDQIYDTKTGVVFSASDMPENLFETGNFKEEWSYAEREILDDLSMNKVKQAEELGFLSGENEAFSLKRMISRLHEMKSTQYWEMVMERRS